MIARIADRLRDLRHWSAETFLRPESVTILDIPGGSDAPSREFLALIGGYGNGEDGGRLAE